MRVNSSSSNTRARHNSRPRASTSLSPRIRSLRFSRVNSWRPRAYKTQPGIPFLSPSLVLHHCHYRIFTAVSVAGLREREERKGRKKKKEKEKGLRDSQSTARKVNVEQRRPNCRRIKRVQRETDRGEVARREPMYTRAATDYSNGRSR